MEKIKVGPEMIIKMKEIKCLAVDYEEMFSFKRRLGITGELGELLICYLFNLYLIENDINGGFDAVDADNNKVEVKAVRKRPDVETGNKNGGRLTKFSKHNFDYCYLVTFDKYYNPIGIWRASREKLTPIIERQNGRNMKVRDFQKAASKIDIPKSKIMVWEA